MTKSLQIFEREVISLIGKGKETIGEVGEHIFKKSGVYALLS
ncbi:hypothetical protein [Paenibacillus konkukensis]|nr:hypothetical protein [Paenibacillus konkukensis]